jgi:hypothetical protein
VNKSLYNSIKIFIICVITGSIYFTGCAKNESSSVIANGTFPDTVVNLEDINSEYDDYNISLYRLTGNSPIIFSSNRKSSGGQFDLEQASISFEFDQTNGSFGLEAVMTEDLFLDKLIKKAETPGNDFGPYRLFSSLDGYEYLLLSSVNAAGNLDLYYLKNRPANNFGIPDVLGPFPVKLLNTVYDDAYICFDLNLDSAYFTTNQSGNFDIFLQKKPVDKDMTSWFNMDYTSSTRVDSINSSSNDKCPMVLNKLMVFASNRPGGMGGYDLYYSLFRKGNWSSPVNLGPEINTSSDEYRPVIGHHPDFTNLFMMFSSNRPGGKGGFDLYFSGLDIPKR